VNIYNALSSAGLDIYIALLSAVASWFYTGDTYLKK
jgi:hypothetical protein